MKPLLDVFGPRPPTRPPLWLMRQAGRYLPEYRAIRAKARHFLDFCYSPELAIEATLQPIRRFGFDAAIIFSDILVIPDALGQKVAFLEGEGPKLEPIPDRAALAGLSSGLDLAKLEPIYAALRGVRAALPEETTLIGFAGAPWTLATYMIAGQGTPDQAPARRFAYADPEGFAMLMERLVEAVVEHLSRQIEAGAEVVQIFDSWAGTLPEAEFERWCVAPVAAIVRRLKERHPEVPLIGFPRGIAGGFARYVEETGVHALGFDTAARLTAGRQELPESIVSQGNLDPLVLIAGGSALDGAVEVLRRAVSGRRHIANLGHGILPQTPIAHVERLVELLR